MKKNAKQKTVFVGMSGGVDSSVAAALLKKEGYNVVGVHLKCFNVDGCAAEDAEDARRAAEHLGIPFYAFDYEQEYKDLVVKYMVDGYKKGITPNPDVMCNKEIKFGLFYKKALEMGADYVATGHYVRKQVIKSKVPKVLKALTKNPTQLYKPYERYELLTARDSAKDQSYFLWTLKPEQLKHCLFPIGDYKKPQVRKLAEKFGLHNAAKKDSQGICFLGQVSLPDFLKKYIKPKRGDIILVPPGIARPSLRGSPPAGGRRGNLTEKPIVIGTHNGAHFYTIGQRQGLGIGGFKKPLYIAAKDIKKNTITVVEGDDHPALFKKEVVLTDVNFFDTPSLRGAKRRGNLTALSVFARVRYRQLLFKASLISRNIESLRGAKRRGNLTSFMLQFDKPVKFIAPGQSAVFYDKKGTMMGGGVIVS